MFFDDQLTGISSSGTTRASRRTVRLRERPGHQRSTRRPRDEDSSHERRQKELESKCVEFVSALEGQGFLHEEIESKLGSYLATLQLGEPSGNRQSSAKKNKRKKERAKPDEAELSLSFESDSSEAADDSDSSADPKFKKKQRERARLEKSRNEQSRREELSSSSKPNKSKKKDKRKRKTRLSPLVNEDSGDEPGTSSSSPEPRSKRRRRSHSSSLERRTAASPPRPTGSRKYNLSTSESEEWLGSNYTKKHSEYRERSELLWQDSKRIVKRYERKKNSFKKYKQSSGSEEASTSQVRFSEAAKKRASREKSRRKVWSWRLQEKSKKIDVLKNSRQSKSFETESSEAERHLRRSRSTESLDRNRPARSNRDPKRSRSISSRRKTTSRCYIKKTIACPRAVRSSRDKQRKQGRSSDSCDELSAKFLNIELKELSRGCRSAERVKPTRRMEKSEASSAKDESKSDSPMDAVPSRKTTKKSTRRNRGRKSASDSL